MQGHLVLVLAYEYKSMIVNGTVLKTLPEPRKGQFYLPQHPCGLCVPSLLYTGFWFFPFEVKRLRSGHLSRCTMRYLINLLAPEFYI